MVAGEEDVRARRARRRGGRTRGPASRPPPADSPAPRSTRRRLSNLSGDETGFGAGVEAKVLARSAAVARAVRPAARIGAPVRACSSGAAGGMIAVRVRDEDMRDLARRRSPASAPRRARDRPGRDRAPRAHSRPIRNVLVPRKVKGPAFGAVTRRTPGRDLDRLAVARFEIAVEGERHGRSSFLPVRRRSSIGDRQQLEGAISHECRRSRTAAGRPFHSRIGSARLVALCRLRHPRQPDPLGLGEDQRAVLAGADDAADGRGGADRRRLWLAARARDGGALSARRRCRPPCVRGHAGEGDRPCLHDRHRRAATSSASPSRRRSSAGWPSAASTATR